MGKTSTDQNHLSLRVPSYSSHCEARVILISPSREQGGQLVLLLHKMHFQHGRKKGGDPYSVSSSLVAQNKEAIFLFNTFVYFPLNAVLTEM